MAYPHTFMTNNILRHIITLLLLCFLALPYGMAQKMKRSDYFYVLNTSQGLSDNAIFQMIQLPDGRLAVRTKNGINLYDGKQFRCIPLTSGYDSLKAYKGQTHLYVDKHDRLIIKGYRQIYCIDTKRGMLIPNPLDCIINEKKARESNAEKHGERKEDKETYSIDDLFVDSQMDTWIVQGNKAINLDGSNVIKMEEAWGDLQDIDTDGEQVYTFHATGTVAAFLDGKLAYTAKAYTPSEEPKYDGTSLIAKTPDGQFYQIRTGHAPGKDMPSSIFLRFNPEKRRFTKIFACDYLLHTLNMSSGNQALISSQRGYLMFDFRISNTPREVHDLALPDGRSLTTGINTVYRDRDGAIWLGTYHDGLIYVSPMLGLFFTTDEHWWQSRWSVALLVTLVLAGIGYWAYYATNRKKRAANNSMADTSDNEISDEVNANEDVTSEAASAESEFIQKVRSIVEEHLQDSEYGVEQLAHDLCMERTGLYKKLTALTETSPVAFIRSIRLQHAAALLKEGKMTVNEIATLTGFSSPSYFAKCFKKEYGVSPSEY